MPVFGIVPVGVAMGAGSVNPVAPVASSTGPSVAHPAAPSKAAPIPAANAAFQSALKSYAAIQSRRFSQMSGLQNTTAGWSATQHVADKPT